MFGAISGWVRKHWKLSSFALIGYWITYAMLCIATGQPVMFPTVTLTMTKAIAL